MVAMREGIKFDFIKKKMPTVYNYWMDKEMELEELLTKYNPQQLWFVIQEMMLINAKFVILRNIFQNFEDDYYYQEKEPSKIDRYYFDQDELIQGIERDSHYYYKELCGYQVNEKAPNSLIFGKQEIVG
ncbi:DUF7006 family protein [Enterococcus camelliae]|uniref:DUF7006 family protein n=1 Tax=Enterococcus camelliae TaxID=453959 RepID=A0ABW5TIC7_9ENTE